MRSEDSTPRREDHLEFHVQKTRPPDYGWINTLWDEGKQRSGRQQTSSNINADGDSSISCGMIPKGNLEWATAMINVQVNVSMIFVLTSSLKYIYKLNRKCDVEGSGSFGGWRRATGDSGESSDESHVAVNLLCPAGNGEIVTLRQLLGIHCIIRDRTETQRDNKKSNR